MRPSVKPFILIVLTSLLASVPANAVTASYDQRIVTGVRADGSAVSLAEAQTVTVEANLQSPEDVERAIEITNELIRETPSDHLSLIETTNADVLLSPRTDAALDSLRSRIGPGRHTAVALSKQAIQRLVTLAANAGVKAGQSAHGALTDAHKLTLMTVRFVSASGAAYVGVSLAAHLPPTVTQWWNTLGSTWQTGAMSAALVMFADAYSDLIINPGFFSRHVDDSKWMKSVVQRFRSFGKTTPGEELPIKLGLYTDQILKSLSLEFVFVFGSTWASAGLSPAIESLSHIISGAVSGGLGQTFFDQTIAILVRAREAEVRDKFPPGPRRDSALKRLDHYRDLGMAANSLAQVWMLLVSTHGNPFATAALHLYLVAGVIVRATVVPLENKLNRQTFEPPETRQADSPNNFRCESLFKAG